MPNRLPVACPYYIENQPDIYRALAYISFQHVRPCGESTTGQVVGEASRALLRRSSDLVRVPLLSCSSLSGLGAVVPGIRAHGSRRPRNDPFEPESRPSQRINSLQPVGQGVPTHDGLGRQSNQFEPLLPPSPPNGGMSMWPRSAEAISSSSTPQKSQ